VVLLHELRLELARLSQLCVDVGASRRRGGGALGPGFWGALAPGSRGGSPSPAPAELAPSTMSPMATMKHSRAGS
jgi:hypothetical protein